MSKRTSNTRAAINGVDLRAFKRQHRSMIENMKMRLSAIGKFAEGTDLSFEGHCEELRRAIVEFDQQCLAFIEYQSETPDYET